IPKINLLNALEFINEIQVISLINKLKTLPNQALVIGVSAGLDSTLALLVAHQAFVRLNLDLKKLIAVTLPTHITSETTNNDSLNLMKSLNLEPRLIDIDNELKEHLKIIDHQEKDTTFENAQARIRTQVLMNLANKYKGIVLGTGDMSEIALGFMTFNADQMSMYNVNSGIPKTLIKEMVSYHANHKYPNLKVLLNKILNKKISPELKINQVTEDIIGKYEINDFILYHHLENGAGSEKLIWLIKETFSLKEKDSEIYVNRFLNLFYQNQFKRIPMPEGVKVLNFSLSPRSDLKLSSMIKRG
ncbi:MAG: NAD(+) synthase, partial [Acholeplasmataceae bacterium]